MIARRLLAVAVAAAWLLPAALAGATALHVAFEHAADHEHVAGSSNVGLETAAVEDPADSLSEAHHEHATVVAPGALTTRRGLDPSALDPSAAASSSWALRVAADRTGLTTRPSTGPPKASGPPLLARLSTLRI